MGGYHTALLCQCGVAGGLSCFIKMLTFAVPRLQWPPVLVALLLWAKRAPFHRKPAPPTQPVTRSSTPSTPSKPSL